MAAEELSNQDTTAKAPLSRSPYPPSTFITACTIAPAVISFPEKVDRPGDNWPVTWAADGNLYSFFADGVGFTPQRRMFSLHPCVLTGNPTDGSLTGRDISTDAIGSGMGGDVKGRKVSGLIALPDPSDAATELLVAWVRNMTRAGGASVMYSRDHGATWTWAWGDPDKDSTAIIRELGHPSWIQAGRSHAAAADGYVYFCSHGGPTAYRVSDHIVVGRVKKESILDRSKYEYFSGTEGNAAWSPDVRACKPAFSAPGQCYRPYGIYNAALKRHFMLTSNGGGIMEGHAGTHDLGIYESANPWGPWRTVYWNGHFQPQWGVFSPQIVPAWISEDGKTCWLLYSCWPKGPYKFNLQRVVLTTAP